MGSYTTEEILFHLPPSSHFYEEHTSYSTALHIYPCIFLTMSMCTFRRISLQLERCYVCLWFYFSQSGNQFPFLSLHRHVMDCNRNKVYVHLQQAFAQQYFLQSFLYLLPAYQTIIFCKFLRSRFHLHVFKVFVVIYFTRFQDFYKYLFYTFSRFYCVFITLITFSLSKSIQKKKQCTSSIHCFFLELIYDYFFVSSQIFKNPAPSYLSLPVQAPCISFPVSHTPCCRY